MQIDNATGNEKIGVFIQFQLCCALILSLGYNGSKCSFSLLVQQEQKSLQLETDTCEVGAGTSFQH